MHMQGGEREIVIGVDDKLPKETQTRTIPRADVAELCIQSLSIPEASNRCDSFHSSALCVKALTFDTVSWLLMRALY